MVVVRWKNTHTIREDRERQVQEKSGLCVSGLIGSAILQLKPSGDSEKKESKVLKRRSEGKASFSYSPPLFLFCAHPLQ